MKGNPFISLLAVAGMLLAGIQTAKAQKIVLHMAGNQKAEYDVSQLDSINFIVVDSSGDNPSTDPSVTGDAINITNKSATLVGYTTSIRENLANDLRVGFIYCLEGTPNKNNGTQVTVNKNDVAEDGRYTATIENLLSDATYYFRSFVYQSGLWFYGKVKSFITDGVDVDINFTTGEATDITCFSAKVSSSVDVQSNYSTLTYGICYGTNIEPTLNDNIQTAGAILGTGEGTEAYPYTIEDIRSMSLSSSDSVWVIGYLVGTAQLSMNNAVFCAETMNQSNILLSSDSLCSDTAHCIPIELSSDKWRRNLSLPTNTAHFRKCLLVKGIPSQYMQRKGLRSISASLWLGDFDISSVTTSNDFNFQLRQLAGGTTYYYRPYAIVDGQTYYGTVRTFRTLDDNVVETGDIDEETLTVTSHLTIGGGAYSSLVLGVCYGTTEIPTINDYTVTSDEVDEDNNFTVQLAGLGNSTIYYRAYVLIDGIPHYGTVRFFEKGQILKTVLLENFTGQRCTNCPAATEIIEQLQKACGDALVAVGLHGGPLSFAGNAKFVGLKTATADEYYNYWKMDHQPIGMINRHGAVDYQMWATVVKEELAKPAPLRLYGSAVLSDNTITIQINAEGKKEIVTGKLQVWLLEDGIKTLQLMPDGTANLEYIHNNVFRTAVNGTWGEDIAIGKGEIEKRNMEQPLEPNWNPEQLSIVAFVYNDEEVLQTVKIIVKEPYNQ